MTKVLQSLARIILKKILSSGLAATTATTITLGLGLYAVSTGTHAQDYPARTVKIVYPNTAGSAGDVILRAIAEKLNARFSQPFVVENRPGANSVIAATAVYNAPADGYTLYYGAIYPLTRTFLKNPPFDVLNEFEPMGSTFVSSYVLAVNAELPAKSLKELVEHAKRNPGKLNFGAFNTTQTMAWGLLTSLTGADTVLVQYRGSPQATLALVANESQISLDNAQAYRPHAQSGKIRLLAVTNDVRDPTLPDVPTTVELGLPKFKLYTTTSFWTRSGAPKAAQDRMIAALKEVSSMPDIVTRYNASGGTPLLADAAEIKRRIIEEAALYAEAARAAKFEAQ